MAARSKSDKHDALTLIKQDHAQVKDLFELFEDSDDPSEQVQLARKAIEMLKVHAEFEEELFYPAIRKAAANGVIEELEEADEEHHVAKLLIAELEQMSGDEDNFHAKFTVLAENVRHHIKEEEKQVFAKARKSGIDLDWLGEQISERKQELLSGGVPKGYEEEAIEKAGLLTESPSKHFMRDLRMPQA